MRKATPEGFRRINVAGDGNCFFYAVFESAREQGIRLDLLEYRDAAGNPVVYEGNSPSSFSRFMRSMLANSSEYRRKLTDSVQNFNSMDMENFVFIVSELHESHRDALRISTRGNYFYTAANPADERAPRNVPLAVLQDGEVELLNPRLRPSDLTANFVRILLGTIEESGRVWATENEVEACRAFLLTHQIQLAASGDEAALKRGVPNTISVITDGAHYNALVPIEKTSPLSKTSKSPRSKLPKSARRKSIPSVATKKNKTDLIGWFLGKRKQTAKASGVSSWFPRNTRKQPSNLVNSGLNAFLFGDKTRSSIPFSRREMAKAVHLQKYYDAQKKPETDQPLSSREMAKALELQKYYDAQKKPRSDQRKQYDGRRSLKSDQLFSSRDLENARQLQQLYDKRKSRRVELPFPRGELEKALQRQQEYDGRRRKDSNAFHLSPRRHAEALQLQRSFDDRPGAHAVEEKLLKTYLGSPRY